MSNYYNLDSIKVGIEKEISMNKALLEEWKKVKFLTKKDGTSFKVMSKNIDGARYSEIPYLLASGQFELTVTAYAKIGGYVSDSIHCFEHVSRLTDEKKKAKINNYMPKESYLEQIYKYDIEDIKEAVSKRIEYLEKTIADSEKQLASAETVFNNFRTAFDQAVKILENDTKDFNHKTLYYAVKDCIISRYPYV